MEALTRQRDSLARLGEKAGLTPEGITQALGVVRDLGRRNVPPSAVVSYHRSLGGGDTRQFQRLVEEYGGVEGALAARRKELEEVTAQWQARGEALRQLNAEEGRVKESIAVLRDSGVKELEAMASRAKAEIEKLCGELGQDIARWGQVQLEIGKYEGELRLAWYFGQLPWTEEGLSHLVDEIGIQQVAQYLIAALTWSRRKHNPKCRLPRAIYKKYYGIYETTQVELADVLLWALLVLVEAMGDGKGLV